MPDAAPVQYARLPGSGLSRKGASIITVARITCRLWLGDDHLLQVESAGGYSETYKRFYFRDIQAIYLRKTNSWQTVNFVLGTVTGLFLLWTLSVKNIPGVVTLGIITGVFGFFLLLNLLHGSTCKCHLQSAVHLEELPSLGRRRNAEKVLSRLKPLIDAAQGSISAEQVAPQYAGLLEQASVAAFAPGQVLPVAARRQVNVYRGRWHQILFIALLAEALGNTLTIFLPCVPITLLNTFVGAALGMAVIIALVKQHQTDLKPAVGVLTWITGGFVGLDYIVGYFMMIFLTPALHLDGTQWEYIKGLSGLRPLETPWWLGILCGFAAVAGLLGASGLLLLRQHWREKETAA